MASSVEAVIISGPRRDEMVQLADEALDELVVALDRVVIEVRDTLEAFLP